MLQDCYKDRLLANLYSTVGFLKQLTQYYQKTGLLAMFIIIHMVLLKQIIQNVHPYLRK